MVEFLHFDIQSTGQKSHCVNIPLGPSQCYVLIRQSDSPCPYQFLIDCSLHTRRELPPQSLPASTAPHRVRPGRKAKLVPSQPRTLKHGPNVPNLKSQSFSRSYGSILPTSLIHIVLSTRGSSPWRPAAVMSTTKSKFILPSAFHGPLAALRIPQKLRYCTRPHTLAPDNLISG